MQEKKNILTYEGLRKYEDESRATFPRMRNMMQQRMSSAISRQELKNWKRF